MRLLLFLLLYNLIFIFILVFFVIIDSITIYTIKKTSTFFKNTIDTICAYVLINVVIVILIGGVIDLFFLFFIVFDT